MAQATAPILDSTDPEDFGGTAIPSGNGVTYAVPAEPSACVLVTHMGLSGVVATARQRSRSRRVR
jgi:hypothetical protein